MIVMASAKAHRGVKGERGQASMEELGWGSVFSRGGERGVVSDKTGTR